MRINILLDSSKKTIPFNYQPQLTGAIHKWLGENDWHNSTSLYSFSWLQNGKATAGGISFAGGGSMEISAYDVDFIRKIVRGIQKDPYLAFGLTVTDVIIQETPAFSNRETMFVRSPVLIKRMVDGRDIHYTYDKAESGILLTETLRTKLRKAGLPDEGVKVSFLNDYPMARTKIIYYKEIGNRVNICPVVIEGTPEQIAFAWEVGVGSSTGIGFGALK
ncbi:CRISPR-associated endoribonuclease Cas6 [Chitinophaga sp.]|uniref:CRISPR-associated endoribonuclease Cas6 n=1 Tax=Chitinophaga sp. TaxID=1869181 RepID=UPI002F92E151